MSESEPWRLGHRPALDGVRAIAALLVVLTHAMAFLLPPSAPDWMDFAGAGLGVDLFFVLSGFLITTLLLEQHAHAGRISLRGFYVRRVRRLFPAAFTVLGLWSLWSALVERTPARDIAHTAGLVLTYTTNYHHDDAISGLGHYWTLAVEEQFYFVWPLVLVALLGRRVPHAFIMWGVAVLALGVVAHRALLMNGPGAVDAMYRTDARCDGLLVGIALCFAWRRGWISQRFQRFGWLALGGFLAIASLSTRAAFEGARGSLVLFVAVLFAAVMVAAALDSSRSVGAMLSTPVLAYLGRISYSVYLWHVPVIVVLAQRVALPPSVEIVLAFPLSIGVGALSYRLVERRFMSRKGVDLDGGGYVIAGDGPRVHAGSVTAA